LTKGSIILFAKTHSAARRSDHRELRLKARHLFEHFGQRGGHHAGSAMQSARAAVVRQNRRQPLIFHLSGRRAAALCNWETLDRRDAITRRSQCCQGRREPSPERADDSRSHHRHAIS
jgi:hypothetical protein